MLSFNVRTKLVLLLTVFAALPLCAVMPIVFNSLDEMQQGHLDEMKLAAEEIGELIDRNLFERYGDVQAFGVNGATRDTSNWYKHSTENPLIVSMNAYMTNYGLYKIMLLVDKDGKVAAVNSVDNKGKDLPTAWLYEKNYKDANWFKKAMAGEFLKSDVLSGTVVEQPLYESIVSESYKGEDGFVIPFAAPVTTAKGETIGVWVNFADFGLVEDIVKAVHKSKTDGGAKDIGFAIGDAMGTILVNYDPAARAEFANRMPDIIGKKTLKDMEIPASEHSLKEAAGTNVEIDAGSGEEDAVAWAKADGALGYTGLGWTVIMHQPGEHAFADIVSTKLLLFEIMGVAALIIIGVGAFVGTMAARPLRKSSEVAKELAQGNYALTIPAAKTNDELGELTKGMIELRGSVEKSVRLQSVVDKSTVSIMLCDKDFNITYINESSAKALKTIEKHLPISPDKIVGSNIDIFHKNPAHQRRMLADPSKLPHKATFQIGDQWLSLNANALPSRDGSFQGAYVDWSIITAEKLNEESVKLAQEEINTLINAAVEGDLEKRINASQFQGFYKSLAESMNRLMDTVATPVDKSVWVLNQLSNGNLTQKMDGQYKGSFASIQSALNATIDKLFDMVKRIMETAGSVNTASSEIASGSSDLSMRTEQQASSLEETAASMEQITGTVRQNAQNADNAAEISQKANELASKGGDVVKRAVDAMHEIEASSKKVSDIIGVIDEIAFQTNLLALNAAVEAARAGDAGKGFAVVASEVRSLAGRSASASKEIKTLIQESGAQVQSGAALVNEAGSSLGEIVSANTEVNKLISSIASATKEQATGIEEINGAVTQMDEMTQQNAALVEENTAAAQSLVDQAGQLRQLVSFFNIGEAVAESPSTSTARPAAKPTVVAAKKSAAAAKKDYKIVPAPKAKAVGSDDGNWQEF